MTILTGAAILRFAVKAALNTLLTLLVFLLAIPTILILISWNALPGDALYGIKTGLEDAVLVLTARTPLASKFSVQFTERRFSEANKLLSTQGSTIGFALLVEEVEQSRKIIVSKKDEKNASELLAKIEKYQEQIGQQQQVIEKSAVRQKAKATAPAQDKQPEPILPSPSPLPEQVVAVVKSPPPQKPSQIVVPQPVVEQPQKAEEVVLKLEETKKRLEKIKQEIKKELPEAASEKERERLKELERKEDSQGERGGKHGKEVD